MRKRLFDVVVVSLAAVVWLPVVALAALAVLVFSGRPIMYRSQRWVDRARVIEMVKLRVMVRNANQIKDCANGDQFLNTVPGSSLYTGIGRILDRLGLNEIPQFLHVLRGEMSIVGARPLTHEVREALVAHYGFVDDRWDSDLPAGLTGLPQLVGRSALTADDRLLLERTYARRMAEGYRLRADFQILLYTVLITFGLKKPLSVDSAVALVTPRRSRVRVAELHPQMAPVGDIADVA